MPGVFHLCNILKLVIHGFHQCSFEEDYLVIHRHKYVPHVTFDLGDQLYAIQEKEVKKPFVDVSFVPAEFAAYLLHKGSIFQRIPVIGVGRSYHEVEQFSSVIDDYMKLETEEPSHGAFATLGYTFENFVIMDPFVVADLQRSRINVGNACTFPK